MPRVNRPTSGGNAEWIRCDEAAAILGVDVKRVTALAASGHIGVKHIPGTWPRYSRADVEALARDSIQPAGARRS